VERGGFARCQLSQKKSFFRPRKKYSVRPGGEKRKGRSIQNEDVPAPAAEGKRGGKDREYQRARRAVRESFLDPKKNYYDDLVEKKEERDRG